MRNVTAPKKSLTQNEKDVREGSGLLEEVLAVLGQVAEVSLAKKLVLVGVEASLEPHDLLENESLGLGSRLALFKLTCRELFMTSSDSSNESIVRTLAREDDMVSGFSNSGLSILNTEGGPFPTNSLVTVL